MKKVLILIAIIAIVSSCSEEESIVLSENNTIKNIDLQVVNNKLKFESKESLIALMEQTNEEEFKFKIKKLTDEGFNSLRPYFDKDDDIGINNFLIRKKSQISKKGFLYSFKGEDNEINLDDDVISDQKFASILNDDREIYVENKYYKYTTNGLYFCDIKDENHLKNYISNLENNIKNKADFIAKRLVKRVEQCDEMTLSPITARITQIDDVISFYEPIVCDGSGGGGSSGGDSNTSSEINSKIPLLRPQSFGSCTYSENSIWQQIFGNRIKCNDYHDSTHRVQTQFWNENYLLWASIGSKVKYQKKRLIGWSESGTADFVELGVNSVKFTYNHVVKQYNPFTNSHILYKYKGVTYGLDGQPISFPANPNPWPYYNKDQTVFELNIFIDNLIKPINMNIDTDLGDVNKAIDNLMRLAANTLPDYLNFNDDVNKNKVRVNIVKIFQNKTEIVVSNRIARDKSKETYRFDLNFLLSFDVGEGKFKSFFDQFKAKKYDIAEINLYGAALRNGVWKGKRIIGEDK